MSASFEFSNWSKSSSNISVLLGKMLHTTEADSCFNWNFFQSVILVEECDDNSNILSSCLPSWHLGMEIGHLKCAPHSRKTANKNWSRGPWNPQDKLATANWLVMCYGWITWVPCQMHDNLWCPYNSVHGKLQRINRLSYKCTPLLSYFGFWYRLYVLAPSPFYLVWTAVECIFKIMFECKNENYT